MTTIRKSSRDPRRSDPLRNHRISQRSLTHIPLLLLLQFHFAGEEVAVREFGDLWKKSRQIIHCVARTSPSVLDRYFVSQKSYRSRHTRTLAKAGSFLISHFPLLFSFQHADCDTLVPVLIITRLISFRITARLLHFRVSAAGEKKKEVLSLASCFRFLISTRFCDSRLTVSRARRV